MSANASSTLSAGQTAVLERTVIYSSSLGMAGSAFIMASYFLLMRVHDSESTQFHSNRVLRLISCLSVVDFLSSLSFFVSSVSSAQNHGNLCYFDGLINQWTLTASFCWTICITTDLRLITALRSRKLNERWFHLFAWGVPTALAIIPIPYNDYGWAGAWCWIIQRNHEPIDELVFVRILPYYVPCVGAILINTLNTIAVIRRVRACKLASNRNDSTRVDNMIRRVIAYPSIQVFIVSWGIANRICELFIPPVFALNLGQALLLPSQGFWNALAYGVNERLTHRYKLFLQRHTSDGHRPLRQQLLSATVNSSSDERPASVGLHDLSSSSAGLEDSVNGSSVVPPI